MARNEPRQGKCEACRIIFTWLPPPNLKDSYCPLCGRMLERTTYLKKWPRRLQYPLTEIPAARLRRQRGEDS